MDILTSPKCILGLLNYVMIVFCFKYTGKIMEKVKVWLGVALSVPLYIAWFIVIMKYADRVDNSGGVYIFLMWETLLGIGMTIYPMIFTVPDRWQRRAADMCFLQALIYVPFYAVHMTLRLFKKPFGWMCEYCGTYYWTPIGASLCHKKMRKKSIPPIYYIHPLTGVVEEADEPSPEALWMLGRRRDCPLCGGKGHNDLGVICERCNGFGKVF